MEYIPSKYTYSQVLEILEREKNKSTENMKNYRYAVLSLYRLANSIGAIIFMLFIFCQFFERHITYLFPWVKVMNHYSSSGNVMLGASVSSLLYLSFWLVLIFLIRKILSIPANLLQKYYVKKGLIIPNKYGGRISAEIKTVYKDVEQFIDYITQNPELTEKDFQMDEAGVLVMRTIHHMDGDEKIKFYFGPHLKEIIIDHTVLDFSKLDRFYELTED